LCSWCIDKSNVFAIARYYRTAPVIVKAINQRADHQAFWEKVYAELVAPCVRLIHAGENEAAYRQYKAYAVQLGGEYLAAGG